MRDYGEVMFADYCNHEHILNAERFAAISRYCTHLQVLFVGWNHDPDWDGSVLALFTQQRTTLQTFVLPTFDMVDLAGCSALRFYATLSRLRQLCLSSHYMGDPLLMDVARSCTELRDIYLYKCDTSNTEMFFTFLKLIPNLELLHIRGEDDDDSSDDESDPCFVSDLLSTLPLQNRKLRTLILNDLLIPRLPHITAQSFPTLRLLDISGRIGPSSFKIENLVDFLQALQALQFLHIDEHDMFFADSDSILLKFIPRTIHVFVSFKPYVRNRLLVNLVRKGTIFDKERFHNIVYPPPWDGLENDIFMDNWEYTYGCAQLW